MVGMRLTSLGFCSPFC